MTAAPPARFGAIKGALAGGSAPPPSYTINGDTTRLARLRLLQEAFQPRSKASIDQDPDVAAFIASRLGKVFLREALAECRERFGASRTPSRSAAQRYWARLRGLKR